MDEIKNVLKYKRNTTVWVCPDCEAENVISVGRCGVCGAVKTSSAKILSPYKEPTPRPPQPKRPSQPRPPVPPTPPKERSNTGTIILWVLIAIMLFVILGAALSEAGYACELSIYNINFADVTDISHTMQSIHDSIIYKDEFNNFMISAGGQYDL